MQISIIVASHTGRTRRMGEAVAEGAEAAGAQVSLEPAAEVREERVLAAHALVLGSGVHMGGMESSMRAFFERTAPLWLQGRLVDKLGAAFVTAGAGGRGGAELTLLSLLACLAEHGCLLVPMPSRSPGYAEGGCHWGPVAWTNPREGVAGPTPAHLEAARAHGEHVARCTRRWLSGGVREQAGAALAKAAT